MKIKCMICTKCGEHHPCIKPIKLDQGFISQNNCEWRLAEVEFKEEITIVIKYID